MDLGCYGLNMQMCGGNLIGEQTNLVAVYLCVPWSRKNERNVKEKTIFIRLNKLGAKMYILYFQSFKGVNFRPHLVSFQGGVLNMLKSSCVLLQIILLLKHKIRKLDFSINHPVSVFVTLHLALHFDHSQTKFTCRTFLNFAPFEASFFAVY